MVDKLLLNLVATSAPSLLELVKKFNVDLSKAKKDDLILLLLIQNNQILENQAKITNDMHRLLQRIIEDTSVLKARTEKQLSS